MLFFHLHITFFFPGGGYHKTMPTEIPVNGGADEEVSICVSIIMIILFQGEGGVKREGTTRESAMIDEGIVVCWQPLSLFFCRE